MTSAGLGSSEASIFVVNAKVKAAAASSHRLLSLRGNCVTVNHKSGVRPRSSDVFNKTTVRDKDKKRSILVERS